MPSVSVIVPCHNVATRVGETIASVQAQSMRDWECVLVDDGSTDATPQRLARVASTDARFRVVTQPNGRLAAARNAGFAAASSDRVLFLDAGDAIEPHALRTLSEILDDDPRAGAAFGGWRLVGPDDRDEDWADAPPRLRLTFPDFVAVNPVNTDALMLRREWLERAGPFDSSLPACEDWDLWLRVARCGCEFAGTDAPLARYRMEPGSHSRQVRCMLDAGLAVITTAHAPDARCSHAAPAYRSGADPRGRDSALADWTLFCAATAFTQGGASAADEILVQAPDAPHEADPVVLGCRLHAAIPMARCRFASEWPALLDEIGPALRAWLDTLESQAGRPGFAAACMERLTALIDTDATADALIETVVSRARAAGLRTLVLYGYGKNGRRLATRLAECVDASIVVADDADAARPITPYLPARDDQLIIVTPWTNERMCRRLADAGARRGRDFFVWTDFVQGAVA